MVKIEIVNSFVTAIVSLDRFSTSSTLGELTRESGSPPHAITSKQVQRPDAHRSCSISIWNTHHTRHIPTVGRSEAMGSIEIVKQKAKRLFKT